MSDMTDDIIPCRSTANQAATFVLSGHDEGVIRFDDETMRGRGFFTPAEARQLAAALVRRADAIDPPTTSGTGPGAVGRSYGRVAWEAECQWRSEDWAVTPAMLGSWEMLMDDDQRKYDAIGNAVARAVLADHAGPSVSTGQGARRETYGRAHYEHFCAEVRFNFAAHGEEAHPLSWEDTDDLTRDLHISRAEAVIAAYEADQAADPGAWRDRVAVAARALIAADAEVKAARAHFSEVMYDKDSDSMMQEAAISDSAAQMAYKRAWAALESALAAPNQPAGKGMEGAAR